MTDTIDTPVEADLITVLSSALVAEVMENYFNKELHRTTKKIKVVDLQPQGSGYAFSLAFVKGTPPPTQRYDLYASGPGNVTPVLIEENVELSNNGSAIHRPLETAANVDYTIGRDTKGKFTKKVKG